MSWSLLVFLAANFAAASSGGIFSPDDWFEKLRKPSWQPPNWVFPTVWTVLYAINALAGWMVWETTGFEGLGALAMTIYFVGLILNAAWSAIFFGLKRMGLATFEAVLLWIFVAAQIVVFVYINQTAGLILIPYLIWVSIAIALSASVWRLNSDQHSVLEEGRHD